MYMRTWTLAFFFAAGQLLSLVAAHVEMKYPTPFRSKFLVPQGPNTDFTNTAPLLPDGSNFPCKGYHHDSLPPTATLTAGQSFTLQLDGSATHNGGSCQVSVSYDGGANWIVIHSIVGGCPVDTESYTVPVPSNLPAGDNVLLAWTWVNHTGNREFYMNCAPVVVVGTAGSSFTGPRIFEANIFGQGTCNTVEGVDVVYPNPGSSVHFGGAFVGGNTGPATELANCNFDQNVMLTTTGGSASASAGQSTDGGSTTSTNTTDVTPNTDPSSSPALSVEAPSASPATDAPAVPATVVKAVETQTTLITQIRVAPASTSTPVVDNGSSGSGGNTSGGITNTSSDQAGASCSPDGAIVCASDGLHFFMCDNGALVDMGSVAAGTTCSNGQITRKRGLPPHLHRRHGHSRGRLV